jgi:hypothetical protein
MEWSLYWTARANPVPCRLVPVLAAWADLDERESAVDIEPRHPILTDPVFRIDPVLARFLARSRFTWLAEGTREAYAKDYRLFFSFLCAGGLRALAVCFCNRLVARSMLSAAPWAGQSWSPLLWCAGIAGSLPRSPSRDQSGCHVLSCPWLH